MGDSEQDNSENSDKTYSEKLVEDFLKERNIRCDFEQPVYVKDDKDRPRVWSPDFYLPELGMYVEVCGAKRRAYKFRKEVYKKNKIPVIFVHTYKETKWRFYLLTEMKRITEERSKFLTERIRASDGDTGIRKGE